MRKVCFGLGLTAALILAPAFVALGGSPDLEVREGSFVSILVLGGESEIVPQSLAMMPALESGTSMRSVDSLALTRYSTAFEEYVDLAQNQEAQVTLNAVTGAATIDFPLWVVDSDGNRIELPMTLTTGVPSTIACGGWPFCIGIPSDPDYCSGTAWDTETGELRLVGVALVPDDSELTIECSGIVFELEATILAADTDGDGHEDAFDNCPDHYNSNQADDDGTLDDGIGNVCDNCPGTYNPAQNDSDGDGTGNSCEPWKVNFQPSGAPVPAGCTMDSGAPFSQVNGFGWLGSSLLSRDREVDPDQRLDTFVFTGTPQTWEARLRPASYSTTMAVGDAAYPQGPHTVFAEQAVVFDGATTAAGEHLMADLEALTVSDGRLTLEIGGGGGYTMLDYLEVTESGEQPYFARFINFQPSASTVPEGFQADTGLVHDSARGFGWEVDLQSQTRDRGVLGDPLLDTFVYSGSSQTWDLDLSGDYYDVTISIGDALYAQGPQSVLVEGETWVDDQSTAAGEFLTLSGRLLVVDGALTVTIGGATGNTVLNYVSVTSAPRDLDGDGVQNLNDNCIDLPNPGQGDSNGDGVGDLCSADTDGDGLPDPLDNCPEVSNEDQTNSDSDEYGDACDCAPTNGNVFAPAVEVRLLGANGGEGEFVTVAWVRQDEESGPGTFYDLASGTLSALHMDAGFASVTCLQSDLVDPQYTDQRAASPDDGFYYLVRGDNECEPPGTYGPDDAGARATLDSSVPCP